MIPLVITAAASAQAEPDSDALAVRATLPSDPRALAERLRGAAPRSSPP